MRNLKKVLALGLTSVMMLGMMVVGAGAMDYGDVTDISESTAVAVISAINAMEGDDEGNFGPGRYLERGDAAVIAARIALTRGVVDALTNVSTVYTDVDADDYYSGAVAWATTEGILAGDGTGKFNPTKGLEGYAFAKMLLCVLGYDAEIEEYINNPDWAMNINYDAMMAGLLTGLEGIDMGATMTREQAAVMAFNALTAAKVTYTGSLTTVNGSLTTVYTRNEHKDDTLAKDYKLALVEGETVVNEVTGDYWTINGEKIAGTETMVEATVVLVDAQKDLHKGALKGYTAAEGVKPIVNGDLSETALTAGAGAVAEIEALCGNGVTVEVYAEENADKKMEIYCVRVTNEVLVEADVIYNATKDTYSFRFTTLAGNDAVTSVSAPGENAEPAVVAYYNMLVEAGIEDGDYLLVSVESGAITAISPAEVISGTTTRYATGKSITIDGKEYTYASNVTELNPPSIDKNANQQTIILDSNGYVMYVMNTPGTGEITTVPSVLYVTEIWTEESIRGEDPTWFEGVTMDGEVIEAEYVQATDKGGNDIFTLFEDAAAGTNSQTGMPIAVEYTVKNGVYTFYNHSNGVDGSIGALDAVTPEADVEAGLRLDSYFLADDVKFIYVTENENSATTATVLEGAQKLEAGVPYTVVLSKDANGIRIVSHVFVSGPAPEAIPDYEDGVIFVHEVESKYYTLGSDAETKLAAIDVYLDGEKTEILVEANSEENLGLTLGFNAFSVNEKTGAYELKSIEGVTEKTAVVNETAIGSVVYVNGKYYIDNMEATSAKVYDLCGEGVSTLTGLYNAVEKDGCTVTIAYLGSVEDGVTTIETVYVLGVEDAE